MMKWLCAIFLILLLVDISKCQRPSRVVRIGGIFHKDDYQQVLAFKAAVEEWNANQEYWPHSSNRQIWPLIRLVHYIEFVGEDSAHEIEVKVCKLLSSGVISIFGPSDPFAATYLQSICEAMNIACLQTRLDIRHRIDKQVVNIHPYHEMLVKAYTDVIKSWGWESFALLYENTNSLMIIQKMMLDFAPLQQRFIMRQLPKDGNFRPLLWDLKSAFYGNVFLYASAETTFEVLLQAQQVGMLTDVNGFILSSLDSHTLDLESFQYANANITGFRVVNPHGYAADIVSGWERYSDIPMNITSDTLKNEAALMYDAVFMYATAITNFYENKNYMMEELPILDCDSEQPWMDGESVVNELKMTTIEGLSGHLALDPMGNRTDFNLEVTELLNTGLKTAGYWTKKNNFTRMMDPPEIVISEAISNLVNRTLTVTTILNNPTTMLKESVEKMSGNDQYEGFVVEFLDYLARNLSFRYKIRLVEDGNYGSLDKQTGVWNGMIGEVVNGQSDMVVADISVNSERAGALDFTLPFMTLGIGVLYVKPFKEPPSFFSFMAPFSKDVWISMTIAYVGVSVIIFFVARLTPYEWDNPYPCIEEPDELENQFGFLNSFWFTIGSLMQQGTELAPKAVSTRMASSIWAFFILIIISSYTANLAAFLTSDKPSSPFSEARQLAHQTEIKYGAVGSGSTIKFFGTSTDSDYKVMSEHIAEVQNNDDGMKRVIGEKGKFAFFMESTIIEYQVERNCDLFQVGGWLDNKGYAIGFPKGSPFTQLFNNQILAMKEKGELDLLKTKWWKEKRKGAPCIKEVPNMALGVANVAGVFGLIVFGNLIAALIAFGEFIFVCIQTARKEKVSTWSVAKDELKFILKFEGDTKPARKKLSSKSGESSSESNSVIKNELAGIKRRSKSNQES